MKKTDHGFRFEYKYLISLYTAEQLKRSLPLLLERDAHAGSKGYYDIRSIYFDDPCCSALEEKEAGISDRTKYRIRFYDLDPSFVSMEIKHRTGILSEKLADVLSFAEAEALCSGGYIPADTGLRPVLASFNRSAANSLLLPRVIVDYRRFPFLHPAGNTRITIDTDIRAGRYEDGQLLKATAGIPALEEGYALLEVKFDEKLPSFITDFLSAFPSVRYANSKYCSCCNVLY